MSTHKCLPESQVDSRREAQPSFSIHGDTHLSNRITMRSNRHWRKIQMDGSYPSCLRAWRTCLVLNSKAYQQMRQTWTLQHLTGAQSCLRESSFSSRCKKGWTDWREMLKSEHFTRKDLTAKSSDINVNIYPLWRFARSQLLRSTACPSKEGASSSLTLPISLDSSEKC